MAAHVLRLRLDLLVGSVRGRAAARTVPLVLALALATVVVCAATRRLVDAEPRAAAAVLVVLGAVLLFGCVAGPLLAARPDPMDPRRFAVFGLTAPRLIPALMLGWVVSVPTWALIAWAVSVSAVWRAHGSSDATAALGAALVVVTCVAAARTSRALASLIPRRERPPQAVALVVVGTLLLAAPAVVFLVAGAARGVFSDAVVTLADTLAPWPVGAALSFGATGDGSALAVAAATAVGLTALWVLLALRLATTPGRPLGQRVSRALGWFRALPPTAGGAIAARSIVYWFRDPRHLANLAIVPIAGAIMIVPLLIVGVPITIAIVVPVPVMAALFGWIAHNDLAYDSTAVWMHISAGVRGTADRVGRLVPVILAGVPILSGAILLAIAVNGRWVLLPSLVGVCASLFLCGLGLSSISSAAAPYPAARPGDGAFDQPQRTRGGITQAVVLLGAVALSAPVLWQAWLSLSQSVSYATTTLWAGLGIGVAVACAGILIGGAVFRRRASRLMEFAEAA